MFKNLFFIGIFLLLFSPTRSWSQSIGEFKSDPDAKKTDQRRTVGTGSRSSCQQLLTKNEIILLVPKDKIEHVTASSNPNLYFYTKKPVKQKLLFTLVNLEVSEPIIEKYIHVKTSGYHKITLPVETLDENQSYIWHIGIPCENSEQPLFQDVLSAAIKYRPSSPELSLKLKQAKSNQAKSYLYTKEGIWYDAIDLASENSTYWKKLLSQIAFPIVIDSRKEIANFADESFFLYQVH